MFLAFTKIDFSLSLYNNIYREISEPEDCLTQDYTIDAYETNNDEIDDDKYNRLYDSFILSTRGNNKSYYVIEPK